jgi:hypothetical protein
MVLAEYEWGTYLLLTKDKRINHPSRSQQWISTKSWNPNSVPRIYSFPTCRKFEAVCDLLISLPLSSIRQSVVWRSDRKLAGYPDDIFPLKNSNVTSVTLAIFPWNITLWLRSSWLNSRIDDDQCILASMEKAGILCSFRAGIDQSEKFVLVKSHILMLYPVHVQQMYDDMIRQWELLPEYVSTGHFWQRNSTLG